jgi:two-component system sensor histidine kinase/response regulator
MHVLVAEDNPINQMMATRVLHRLGHTGVVVGDGAQALRCLEQVKFDLVLMDVMMPNMDGLQALAALREREQRTGCARMPVFMATGHDLPGDRERLLQAGADGYVAKPFGAESLQSEIQRVLRR